ncbi:phosphatase PAP2 family protein [Aureibacillus halotolerans]|uniref:Undecaprenyl-diphosphatase n=1 Tax=Aureibacillus halotolerans TaxID=1508390 RepID=A0A4R6U7D3_9BACI|nr:phosphatase PAP2 family protein [Aureibacillus halotolerans]TDQ40475.1 undecaprenyl-diphosphatase [Aureibacillus halotolerans]
MSTDLKQKLPISRIIFVLLGSLVVIASMATFITIAEDILEKERFAFDVIVNGWVEQVNTPAVTNGMAWITELGSIWFLTVLSIGVVIIMIRKKESWFSIILFCITVGGGGLLNTLLKQIFQRERPSLLETVDGIGYSFPSGHTMGSCIAYGMIAYILSRYVTSKRKQFLLLVSALVLSLLIGLSRIFLGVHYPTDILAGFAAGLIWLSVCISALEWRNYRSKRLLQSSSG